jgi:hypothetical protein
LAATGGKAGKIPQNPRNRAEPDRVSSFGMQKFHIHLLDQTGRAIQVIPALAETETIAVVRAAHLASETGAADFEVQVRRHHAPLSALKRL